MLQYSYSFEAAENFSADCSRDETVTQGQTTIHQFIYTVTTINSRQSSSSEPSLQLAVPLQRECLNIQKPSLHFTMSAGQVKSSITIRKGKSKANNAGYNYQPCAIERLYITWPIYRFHLCVDKCMCKACFGPIVCLTCLSIQSISLSNFILRLGDK